MSALPPGLLRPELPDLPAFSVSPLACQAKLDQNESAVDVPPALKELLLEELRRERWNRYPQPIRYAKTKERFAAAVGQPPERVVLTVGCDQMILGAYWAAGGPGRRARVFEPTYPMFAHYALITGTRCERVVLGADFDVHGHGLGERVDVLFLVSPNNPTGDGPDRALVEQALAGHGLVFLDEAYADYAGSSLVDLCDSHANLLCGRSLSKSLLAGLRLGYGVGHPEVIAALERLLFAPYHLNLLQLLVAEHFAEVQPLLAEQVRVVRAERERVAAALRARGLHVWPSRANFLLFAVEDPAAVYAGLLRAGVRIRDVSGMPGLDRHLRVTVGTPAENDLFLSALEDAGRSIR
jgi:histidinol-phosphate aminotransferase